MFLPGDADQAILASLGPRPGTEHVDLREAQGRVLAADIHGDIDQPPFDRVAMDGIAIQAARYAGGQRRFRIAHTQAAGSAPRDLTDGEACIEIMTGAALPPGVDAVIPVERLRIADRLAEVDDGLTVVPSANVHPRGSDQRAGDRVLAAGTRLGAPEIAILASAGAARVPVTRQPRVAVISTGDELVDPAAVPLPWQVRRSNVFAMLAALSARGYRAVSDHHLADELPEITARLAALLPTVDVLVLSGGVSAGLFDHVPAALAAAGVEQIFHKVAQRPGRPLWFGRARSGCLVFGLPGNPVSTLICLTRYVLPTLARLEGAPEQVARIPLAARVASLRELSLFMPVTRRGGPAGDEAVPRPTHGSGDFSSLAGTTGFVEIGPQAAAEAGSLAPIYHW